MVWSDSVDVRKRSPVSRFSPRGVGPESEGSDPSPRPRPTPDRFVRDPWLNGNMSQTRPMGQPICRPRHDQFPFRHDPWDSHINEPTPERRPLKTLAHLQCRSVKYGSPRRVVVWSHLVEWDGKGKANVKWLWGGREGGRSPASSPLSGVAAHRRSPSVSGPYSNNPQKWKQHAENTMIHHSGLL